MVVSPYADTPATTAMLVDVSKPITAYYTEVPDPAVPEQRVVCGTSGYRGSALATALLAAEITARMGRDPGAISRDLTREFGEPVYGPCRGAGHPILEEAQAIVSEAVAAAGQREREAA